MVYNTTIHPTTLPPPTETHCLYILYIYFGKGGGVGEVREKVEGQQYTRGVPTWLTVSPVYKIYETPVKTTFRVLCLYNPSSMCSGIGWKLWLVRARCSSCWASPCAPRAGYTSSIYSTSGAPPPSSYSALLRFVILKNCWKDKKNCFRHFSNMYEI